MSEPLPADLAVMDPEQTADILVDRIELAQRAHADTRPKAFTARDALIALDFESTLVAVAASNIAQGLALSEEDLQRLWLACSRIHAARHEVAPRRARDVINEVTG